MKKFKFLFAIFISSLYISNAYSASIDNIQAIDSNNIKVIASQDIIFSDIKVYGEVKVLKDIKIINSSKDSLNTRKVTLNLDSDLSLNSSYSLISVLGAEGNIEFEIGDDYIGEKINLNYYNEEKIIEKIVIIDSKTIEVYYNYDITANVFEYKLLSELKIDSFSSDGNNILNVKLSTPIKKSSSYIFMIISLENIDGKELTFDNFLYDFTTNSNLIDLEQQSNEQFLNNEQLLFNENIENIALNAAETPDSGAETWFVMLLTFIVSTFYFTRNRFKKT
ncbi:MAG: hypothetical protein PHI37_01070 [Candidatus Gracilibacteria bacterium]|nr:hypothetical protein [Candidatus Gracilibacteria bacterium]